MTRAFVTVVVHNMRFAIFVTNMFLIPTTAFAPPVTTPTTSVQYAEITSHPCTTASVPIAIQPMKNVICAETTNTPPIITKDMISAGTAIMIIIKQ